MNLLERFKRRKKKKIKAWVRVWKREGTAHVGVRYHVTLHFTEPAKHCDAVGTFEVSWYE